MRILTVDSSLTDTGLSQLKVNPDRQVLSWTVHRVKTDAKGWRGGIAASAYARNKHIVRTALELFGVGRADLVILEYPALSRSMGKVHDRAGLWWMFWEQLHEEFGGLGGAAVLTPMPNLRAKYATGKANAGKDEVMAAAIRRYPHVLITNNNEADAAVWAAIGARLLGAPLEERLPAKNLEALQTINLQEGYP